LNIKNPLPKGSLVYLQRIKVPVYDKPGSFIGFVNHDEPMFIIDSMVWKNEFQYMIYHPIFGLVWIQGCDIMLAEFCW